MKIVLIGAPGSGKGTLAVGLEKKLGLKHLSFGQIVRQFAKNNPEVKKVIDNGGLIDDALAKQILFSRLNHSDCQNGFLLDGFPRNISQAKILKQFLEIDLVLFLEISETEIYQRLAKRLSCPKCNMVYNKSIYHLENCNVCGAKLECRADDNSMAIQKRIDIFNQNKDALLEFYGNKVKAINAEAVAEDVQEAAINIIKESKVGCKNTK